MKERKNKRKTHKQILQAKNKWLINQCRLHNKENLANADQVYREWREQKKLAQE